MRPDDMFTFSFNLECSEPVIKKQFNMCRARTETMDGFMNRLNENLAKKLSKKKNKKSKKSEQQDCGSTTPVNDPVTEVAFKLMGELIPLQKDASALDFLSQKGLEMSILKVPFEIEINPPLIQSVKLPDTVMAGYLVYPFKMIFEYASQTDSIFDWYVSEPNIESKKKDSLLEKTKWTKRSSGFFYLTSNEDIDRYVKLEITPRNGDRIGIKLEVITKNCVSAGK